MGHIEQVVDAESDRAADLARSVLVTADAASVLQAQELGHFLCGKAEALADGGEFGGGQRCLHLRKYADSSWT